MLAKRFVIKPLEHKRGRLTRFVILSHGDKGIELEFPQVWRRDELNVSYLPYLKLRKFS